jgi:prepilin-type N-terminal cleavage/methylation domain-containing protein
MVQGTIRNERGFTLAELLIACAIIGMVMSGIFGILNAGQQSYQVGVHMIEAQQDPRITIQRIANEVREAGYCPTCGGTIAAFNAITSATATGFIVQNDWNATWNGTSGIAASGTVSWTVVNSDGSTTTTQRGERVTYAFASGTLTRQETGVDASPVTLATNVASITFSYLDASGTVLATPVSVANEPNIRSIVITMVGQPQVQAASFQGGRVYVPMTDTIRLRNRVQ